MSNPIKNSETGHSASEKTLEERYSESLELVNSGRLDTANAALEALQTEALAQGKLGMVRSIRNYLAAIQARTKPQGELAACPELTAQISLNKGDVDGALAILDAALEHTDKDARLFYLKALALAIKEQIEDAAEALRRAIALNHDFVHQFRLERDFDSVRSTASFASLELA